MNVLSKLTLRNLKLNRKRTIVTLIGIILSGAMISAVASLIFSFQQTFIDNAKMTDGAHFVSFYDVPVENRHRIETHAYTETAIYSRDVGFAEWSKIDNKLKKHLYIKAYDEEAFTHFPVHLKEGRFPENEREIVIADNLLKTGGHEYAIGETMTVNIGHVSFNANDETETFVPHETRTFTITGWVETPRNEYYNAPYSAYTFLNKDQLVEKETVNISIIGTSVNRIYDMAPEMAEFAGADRFVYNRELLKWMGMTQNDYVREMMYSVGAIILILIVIGSVTVIYNAFAISVSERKKQFGMLSSVGATQRQIRNIVFKEGAVLAVIGIPIGILSGVTGIAITLKVINGIMAQSTYATVVPIRLVVSMETVLLSVVLMALTIFLSAFIPAKRAANITPIEAIRLNTDIQMNRRKLKTSRLSKKLFGIEGDLALKNLKRNRKKYRATVFSLFISIVLYISFSSFLTYGTMSSEMYYATNDYDMVIQKTNTDHEVKLKLYEQIASLEEIEYFSIQHITWQLTTLEKEQLGSFITELIDTDHPIANEFFPQDEHGSYPLHVHVISIGERAFYDYVRDLGYEVADFMDTETPRGILVNRNRIQYPVVSEYKPLQITEGNVLELMRYDELNERYEPYRHGLEISAIAEDLPFGVSYSSINEVKLIVSEPVFEHIVHEQNASDEIHSVLYIRVAEGIDRTAFIEQIEQIDASLQSGPLVHISDHTAIKEETERTNLVISIFLYGFIGLITLIGVTNIFNTISTNVALRRREFAMLKSVGMTPAGFNKMMNFESIFYGLKSLLYGLPVGILISVWMYQSVHTAFQFSFVLPWKEIVICIVAVFLIVFLTMLHSSSKLKRENIIDALKEENL